MSDDCGCGFEARDEGQRRVLQVLLAVNGTMFVVEAVAGFFGESTGLLADSLDMLADAFVYAIALSAVGVHAAGKRRAARVSGYAQIVLGILVAAEVVRRVVIGGAPEPLTIGVVGLLALSANLICLSMIYRHRSDEIHMRASWIFSANDVVANLGVILGGVLVAVTGSQIPDLIVGAAIAALVAYGGLRILAAAREEAHEDPQG